MSEYVSKEELKEFFESIEITVAGRTRAEAISEVLQAIYNGVMELPTTDAEPVRHGKNIGTDYDETDQFVCSECGIELQGWYRVEHDEDDDEETIHEYRVRYCPQCGARVNEE